MREDVYAELKNKIRWSITTTMGAQSNIPFRVSNELARNFAQELLSVFKAKEEKPDLDLVAHFVHLYQIGTKPLDKIVADK